MATSKIERRRSGAPGSVLVRDDSGTAPRVGNEADEGRQEASGMATIEGIAEAISLETVNKFIKSGFVRIAQEEDRCQITFRRDALQWYVSEGILRALAMAMKATDGGRGNGRWQPTHQHYKGGLYREIARGQLEADQTPVVIYDDQKGQVWVRPVKDFDQIEPFVRFAAISQ
jgi:hypothetical protein